MKIYTSYFSKIKQIKENFNNPYFVSIARHINDDIKKHINKEISWFMPSSNLLFKYKKHKNFTEQDYIEQYKRETFQTRFSLNIYNMIADIEKYDGVFLLCYEKSDSFCHRHILKDFLNNKYDLKIEEYK